MDAKTISIIALVISIVVPICEYFYSKKMNNVNLDAQYYDDVYKDFLMKKIPQARLKIQRLNNGTVVGIEEMRKLLRQMRKQSLYFKFYKKDFYNELLRLIQRLEDELVMLDDNVSKKDYETFIKKMENMISDIYDWISRAARGKGVVG